MGGEQAHNLYDMPEKNVEFESLCDEIGKWAKESDEVNPDLKMFLSMILIRYRDTKQRINYLKHHISDSKHLEYLNTIDDNLKASNFLYELALMNLIDSRNEKS